MKTVIFKTYNIEAELKYPNELEAISSAKEFKEECEKALQEKLELHITPKGITCVDSLDRTIFSYEYKH